MQEGSGSCNFTSCDMSSFNRRPGCEEPGCNRTFRLGGRHHCRSCSRSVCGSHFSRPLCSSCKARVVDDHRSQTKALNMTLPVTHPGVVEAAAPNSEVAVLPLLTEALAPTQHAMSAAARPPPRALALIQPVLMETASLPPVEALAPRHLTEALALTHIKADNDKGDAVGPLQYFVQAHEEEPALPTHPIRAGDMMLVLGDPAGVQPLHPF